jgi:hypothetical protein
MPRRNENCEVEETTKLEVLRATAHLGTAALDRGEFEEFADGSALVAYLNNVADDVLSGTEGS